MNQAVGRKRHFAMQYPVGPIYNVGVYLFLLTIKVQPLNFICILNSCYLCHNHSNNPGQTTTCIINWTKILPMHALETFVKMSM